jgi:MoaA/NifB/PqqE/SkfB family radical SAM enzyme
MFHRLRYSPFLVQLVVTRRCNLSCGYCNEYDDVSEPVPTDELQRRMDQIKALGAWACEFTGGEPMMHPDLVELVRYAKRQARFHRVMLISNAFLLNEAKVRELNDAGLDDLQVSIDGVEPNDVTVKVLKPLRNKLEAIARAARFRVTLNAVAGSSTLDEVLEVVAFARAHHFRSSVQFLHGGDGQLQVSGAELAAYRRVKGAVGRSRFGGAGDYRTRLIDSGSAPFKCRAGSRYLYVDEHGVVRWCSQQRESFGIELAKYTREDLRRQFYTRKDCSATCTVGCARASSAADEWRRQDLQPDAAALPAGELVSIRRRSTG